MAASACDFERLSLTTFNWINYSLNVTFPATICGFITVGGGGYRRGMGKSYQFSLCIFVSICLPRRAIKEKRLELSAPKSVVHGRSQECLVSDDKRSN